MNLVQVNFQKMNGWESFEELVINKAKELGGKVESSGFTKRRVTLVDRTLTFQFDKEEEAEQAQEKLDEFLHDDGCAFVIELDSFKLIER